MKRREFISRSVVAAGVMPCLGIADTLLRHSVALAQSEEVLSLDNPTAKALGYVHDASKVDTSKWPKRAGEEGAAQFCHNCNLLVGEAKEIEGKEGKWIGCQLFPGKLVNTEGWCNSWIKKVA